ncbi:MAG: hypothetical protein AB7G39_12730 [Alphaproteobacteria bacterium]
MAASRAETAAIALLVALLAGAAGVQAQTPTLAVDREGIRIQPLAYDPSGTGTLNDAEGGLGADMWKGTPRALIEQLVPDLPAPMASPAMRGLARRLLLTAATLPTDGAGNAAPGQPDLIAKRIERLYALGDFRAAHDLIALAPKRTTDPTIQRVEAELALLVNDLPGACAAIGDDLQRRTQPYWQRLLAACQTVGGQKDAAMLSTAMLAESSDPADQGVLALLDRIAGRSKAKLDSLPDPSLLQLALLRHGKIAVPADAAKSSSPAVMAALADSPSVTPEMRLAAAEAGAVMGSVTPQRLSEIYAALEVPAAALDAAATAEAAPDGARGRAILYQAATVQTDPAIRAAMLRKTFRKALEDGVYLPVVATFQPVLDGTPPAATLAFFAEDAARALYTQRRPVPARNWLKQLQFASAQEPAAEQAANALWLLAMLADPPPATAGGTAAMDRWEAAIRARAEAAKAPAGTAAQRIAVGYTLLDGVGEVVPAERWRALLGQSGATGGASNVAIRRALTAATLDRRRGEAVLLALLALGPGGPAKASVETMQDVLTALRVVGLDADARALALEAALAAGL